MHQSSLLVELLTDVSCVAASLRLRRKGMTAMPQKEMRNPIIQGSSDKALTLRLTDFAKNTPAYLKKVDTPL